MATGCAMECSTPWKLIARQFDLISWIRRGNMPEPASMARRSVILVRRQKRPITGRRNKINDLFDIGAVSFVAHACDTIIKGAFPLCHHLKRCAQGRDIGARDTFALQSDKVQ